MTSFFASFNSSEERLARALRSKEMGPLVTLKDLLACFPYDDLLTRYVVTGEKLKKIFAHIMRPENRNGEGECYQVNCMVRATYNDSSRQLVFLQVGNEGVSDYRLYRICLQSYHIKNSFPNLDVTNDELLESGKSKVVSTSARNALEEYLRNNQNISRTVEGRLTYIK